MITDELLERGLAGAADKYDVPAGAIDRLRTELAPELQVERRRLQLTPKAWLVSSAAALIVLIVVAVAVGGGSGGSGESAGSGKTASGAVLSPTHGRVNAPGIGEPGSTSSSDTASVPGAVAAPMPAPTVADRVSGSNSFASGAVGGVANGGGGSAGQYAPSATELSVSPRIEKTGDMDLQVGKGQVSQTLDAISGLAVLYRGIVADSHTTEGSDPSGQVTLRIPVNSFEVAISRIRHLAGVKVNSVETSAQDVTSQYVDLQARIHSLQATRSTYLRILEKASTIGEILSVQQRVNDVQTQIEQLQGQLNVLSDQTSLGTLTVSVDQKHAPSPVVHHKSGLTKAVDRSVNRFVHGIEAIIGVLGPILLVLLVVAFGWLAARLGYRRFRRQLV